MRHEFQPAPSAFAEATADAWGRVEIRAFADFGAGTASGASALTAVPVVQPTPLDIAMKNQSISDQRIQERAHAGLA